MSSAGDFVIEDGVLKQYVGPGGDVDIPEGVKEIGARAFEKCSNLMKITIPGSVKKIGDWAFQKCENLVSIIIPENVQSIGIWAFESCKSLTDVIILGENTFVDNYAFGYCFHLNKITIPDSATLGVGVFTGCKGLADTEGFVIVHGILQHYSGTSGDIHIPNGVIQIGRGAFENYRNLRSVTIPEGVTSIGSHAFL